jgi:hypothetical protein
MFKWLKTKAKPAIVKIVDTRTKKIAFSLGVPLAGAIFASAGLYVATENNKNAAIDFKDLTTLIVKDFQTVYNPTGLLKTGVKINLIKDGDNTACGLESLYGGLFYCPSDKGIYINQKSQDGLCVRFKGCKDGVSKEIAYIYVLAHELAHHIQYTNGLLGLGGVKVELQSDCLTGYYMGKSFKSHKLAAKIKDGALHLANAIGDDIISGNTTKPSEYTHGSGKQRQEYFLKGYNARDAKFCL